MINSIFAIVSNPSLPQFLGMTAFTAMLGWISGHLLTDGDDPDDMDGDEDDGDGYPLNQYAI